MQTDNSIPLYTYMIVMITTFNLHTYNHSSYHTKKNLIKNLWNFFFKKKKIFLTLSLLPENPPEDRYSGIPSFTGPDRPGSASKTTGRTGFSISKPAKRPGQPEINFTGFLHTLIASNHICLLSDFLSLKIPKFSLKKAK